MQDLISRQAAIDGKISIQRTNGVEMYSDEAVPVEYLKVLPSAQPSRIEQALHGKTPEEQYKILYQLMFEYANTFNDARRAVIDWLGEYQEKLSDFCPNCGADMREGQDERHD